jgi:hypothetical protein
MLEVRALPRQLRKPGPSTGARRQSMPGPSIGKGVQPFRHEVGRHDEPIAKNVVAVAAAGPSRRDPAGHDAGQMGYVVTAACASVEFLGAVCDLAIAVKNETSVTHGPESFPVA